jgi:hypothetical protein
MLWIQYESTRRVRPDDIGSIARTIAGYVMPYGVTIFDRGDFGVGLVVAKATSDSDSWDLETDSDSGSHPGWIATYPNSFSTFDLGTNLDGGRTVSGSDGQFAGGSSDTGNNGRDGAETAPHAGRGNDGRSQNTNDGDQENDGDRENREDPSSVPETPIENQKFNDRFAGTLTLRVGNNLCQELTTSFGLKIYPTGGSNFADCKISLDPVIVRASTLFKRKEEGGNPMVREESLEHFYVTEKVRLILGTLGGSCYPPDKVHPLLQHFTERRIISSKVQRKASFQLAYPFHLGFIFGGSKAKENTDEYDPVTVALEPEYIGTAARNDHEWRYRPKGLYGTNIELSTENPPHHQATYRVHESDIPQCLKVTVQATFRKHGKLERQKSKAVNAAMRLLRDLNNLHIVTTFEVKIGNDGHDWFLFPCENKQGCRLGTAIEFDGDHLGVGWPREKGSLPRVCSKFQGSVEPT